ncbi:MAG: hypothetical protein ACLTR6_06535 [Clostridium fessum]
MTAEEVHTDLGHQDVFEPSENEWETVSMGNEDEWNEPISGETDSEPIDGYYKTLESERGEAKGQFLCPGGFQNGCDCIRKGDRDGYRGDTEKTGAETGRTKSTSG